MGTTALVTGANTGIGFEAVCGLLQKGMTVYLAARDPAKGEAAAALAKEGDVRFVRIDTTDVSTFQPALGRIEAEQGRLDVLVNNAGAAFPGNVLDIDPEVLRLCLETNLHGPVRLTQLALPLLRKSDDARIIMVSSGAGRFEFFEGGGGASSVLTNLPPYGYGLSKAGINVATALFAGALKDEGIRVNACNPGYVNSLVSRFKGTRTPAQGAEIIIDLATTDSEATGKFFDFDGSELTW
ncbi:MAG: SDR family NAD(P)-dependent oxidoreductase [Alphaproteobacteria bacterium]|nr:SDR family NAD(P)-dependent oxidoreductase [Alphaproteobacteria bacterium]